MGQPLATRKARWKTRSTTLVAPAGSGGEIAVGTGMAWGVPRERAAAKLSMLSWEATLGNIQWRSRCSVATSMVGRTLAL